MPYLSGGKIRFVFIKVTQIRVLSQSIVLAIFDVKELSVPKFKKDWVLVHTLLKLHLIKKNNPTTRNIS